LAELCIFQCVSFPADEQTASMPEPPDYLNYARECKRLALEAVGPEDRELLLEMARAWTELAVDKSAPPPEQSAAP
jgi:hypothetical protein